MTSLSNLTSSWFDRSCIIISLELLFYNWFFILHDFILFMKSVDYWNCLNSDGKLAAKNSLGFSLSLNMSERFFFLSSKTVRCIRLNLKSFFTFYFDFIKSISFEIKSCRSCLKVDIYLIWPTRLSLMKSS